MRDWTGLVFRITPIVTLTGCLLVDQSSIRMLRATVEKQRAAMEKEDAVLQQADGILKSLAGTPCSPSPELQKRWDEVLGKHKSTDSSIFHVPANGQCPAGTTRMRDTFTERDGSHKDACYNPKGEDGSIDVLNPGESVGITIQMLPPPPPGKDRRS
jgi:hypothetical protein